MKTVITNLKIIGGYLVQILGVIALALFMIISISIAGFLDMVQCIIQQDHKINSCTLKIWNAIVERLNK